MMRWQRFLVGVVAFGFWSDPGAETVEENPPVTLVVVTGISGAEEYQNVFASRSADWLAAGEQAGAETYAIGTDESETSDKERLRTILETEVHEEGGQLWLIFNGHGTFDGAAGKFNLRGRDVSAKELSEWLKPCQRELAVVNGFSASAPFVNALSGPNRVIISATKSGYELNFSRFGGFVADAIGSLEADLDKDGQVSLLEAFLSGARETDEYYQLDGRLASEHAVIDDTGDQRGTTYDFYRGVRVVKQSKEKLKPDGRRAHQFHLIRSEFEKQMPPALRERRDALELDVLALRDQKASFDDETTYYEAMEPLLLELAALYGEVEAAIAAQESETTATVNPNPVTPEAEEAIVEMPLEDGAETESETDSDSGSSPASKEAEAPEDSESEPAEPAPSPSEASSEEPTPVVEP